MLKSLLRQSITPRATHRVHDARSHVALMHDARSHVTHAHLVHVHAMHLHRTCAVHPHPRAVHAMHAATPDAARSNHVTCTPAGTIAEARAIAVAAVAVTMAAV